MVKTIALKANQFINRNENLRQSVVYTIIGGICGFFDLVLLFIFVDFLKIWYLLAAAISFILVSIFGFYCHKRFTFRHTGSGTGFRYVIFLLTAGSGLLWNLLLLYISVSILHIWYLLAAAIVKFIVLIWNFLMNKFVTFRTIQNK